MGDERTETEGNIEHDEDHPGELADRGNYPGSYGHDRERYLGDGLALVGTDCEQDWEHRMAYGLPGVSFWLCL